ncbi:MAG: hypothetical protein ACON4W_08055 [Parvibaculales bacterium]
MSVFAAILFSRGRSRVAAPAGLVLASLLLLTVETAAKEKATRSPLNIIPKTKVTLSIERDVPGQQEPTAASLPQLKPGGVKLARPVRQVAALPGGSGAVQVGELGNLEDTDIGLQKGLGPQLWRASRLSTVTRLFKRIPSSFKSPVATSIAYQLMTTEAAPPPGLSDKESFFAQRLIYLMQLGEIEAVSAMIDMTGAQLRDPLVTRLAAEVALVNNDVPAACGLLGQFARLQAPAPIQDFATKLRAVCQLEAGDVSAAMLTLDLARESGIKDTLFLDAMFALTAEIPYQRSQPVQGNRLSVLQSVILLKAGARLFAPEVAHLNPALVARFAKNLKQPQNIQLLLAQRGVMLKTIEPVYLRALMDMVEFGVIAPAALEADTIETMQDTSEAVEPADDIIVRARQMRIIDEPVTPEGKILALQDLLLSALMVGDWELVVDLLAPNLQAVAPALEYADFALYAVPAFVYLGDLPRAAAWYDVLLERQNGLPSAKSRNLNGLIRLMDDVEEQVADEQAAGLLAAAGTVADMDDLPAILGVAPMEAVLMNAILETGTVEERAYVASEINMLPLFGYEVPSYLRQTVETEPTDKVLARTLADMEKAVAAGDLGTALLHGLIAVGRQERQNRYDMAAMRRVMQTLQTLGLDAEARDMARHLLTRQAAQLVIGG